MFRFKNMDKETIDEIRNRLNFMEEFDTFVRKAQEKGDAEWENDLYAAEGNARYRLRELVDQLLGDIQDGAETADEEPF